MIKATGKNLPVLPSYSQICRRTSKLNIPSNRQDDDGIIIAIDSTGIKVTNRGQWMMQEKWPIKKKKGHLKIHTAVNIRTKEILGLKVTDEKVHDGKVMEQLIEQILENKNIKINSVLADDGVYDSNDNFKYLQKKRIQP